jgi:hypothetical protein
MHCYKVPSAHVIASAQLQPGTRHAVGRGRLRERASDLATNSPNFTVCVSVAVPTCVTTCRIWCHGSAAQVQLSITIRQPRARMRTPLQQRRIATLPQNTGSTHIQRTGMGFTEAHFQLRPAKNQVYAALSQPFAPSVSFIAARTIKFPILRCIATGTTGISQL